MNDHHQSPKPLLNLAQALQKANSPSAVAHLDELIQVRQALTACLTNNATMVIDGFVAVDEPTFSTLFGYARKFMLDNSLSAKQKKALRPYARPMRLKDHLADDTNKLRYLMVNILKYHLLIVLASILVTILCMPIAFALTVVLSAVLPIPLWLLPLVVFIANLCGMFMFVFGKDLKHCFNHFKYYFQFLRFFLAVPDDTCQEKHYFIKSFYLNKLSHHVNQKIKVVETLMIDTK